MVRSDVKKMIFPRNTNGSDEKAVVPNGMLKRTVTMDTTINFGLLPS